jgi:hypothetical protein
MSSTDPNRHYSPDPNVLERKAAGYLQWRCPGAARVCEGPPVDAAALRAVERRAVIWAAVAGVVSGGLIGGVEVFVRQGLLEGFEDVDWLDQLPYWIGFFAFAGLVSLIEILFLYWTALHAIARVSRISGLALDEEASEAVARGLARAALEFPNPRIRIYGIDPYALMPNWRITVRALLYRMKVGVSSFMLRVLLRRVLGRMALRGLIPLFTGPLYAVWNAIIIWRIIREARVRALGPAAVEELVARIDAEGEGVRPEAQEVMLHGVGELMMRGYDAHPNYVLLLSRLVEKLDPDDHTIEVDWPQKRRQIGDLGDREQALVLDVLTVAALLGSKVTRLQKDLLREIHADRGLQLRPEAVKRLRTRLIEGQPITREKLKAARGGS